MTISALWQGQRGSAWAWQQLRWAVLKATLPTAARIKAGLQRPTPMGKPLHRHK